MLLTLGLNTFCQSTIESTITKKLYNRSGIYNSDEYLIYDFYLDNNKKVYLAYTISENNNCHACTAKMSVFIAEETNGIWGITKEYINNLELGTYGMGPEKKDVKVYPNGDDFIISIKSITVFQGLLEEFISLYKPYNGTIVLIGGFTIKYDDSTTMFAEESNSETWKAEYFFLEKSNAFPDILLNVTGVKNGDSFSEIKQYVFNGEKYIIKSSN
jgi:hypothetical protein